MKSSVKIGIDDNGGSVIELEVASSDDVRDKLAKRFVEALRHESNWCRIENVGVSQEYASWRISPVDPNGLNDELKTILGRLKIDASPEMPFREFFYSKFPQFKPNEGKASTDLLTGGMVVDTVEQYLCLIGKI